MIASDQHLKHAVNRREFISAMGAAGALWTLSGCLHATARENRRDKMPNIVLIVADDMGYAEFGVQGCKDVPTPNIDSLASGGVRFTDGYVSCPVCSPTRAGLMTGRYQQRFGHEFNPGPPDRAAVNFGLPLDQPTIAERLKPLGYRCGMFGKWHLGYSPEKHPLSRGFDEFFGFLHGAHPYLQVNDNFGMSVMRGREAVKEVDYLTDAFAREAAAFIERNKDVPFFTYLPFNAVHGPLESIQKYLDRFKDIADAKRRTFAAMLSAMDDGVGTVLTTIRKLGLENDTLVIFISDNGGPTAQTTSANTPLSGFKGDVFEGGIRVPYMMQWKGHIPEGQVKKEPVISLDVLPTILAAAGGEVPVSAKLDGANLLPWLSGNAAAPHDRLFWRFGNRAAARVGDWKILRTKNDETWQLYNLADDIAEKKNLAGANPDKLAELVRAYDAWNGGNVPPLWETANEKTSKKNGKGKVRKNKGRKDQ